MNKITFKCANCGKETKLANEARASLVCQGCGCFDISFDSDVVLAPANLGDIDSSKVVTLVKGEPFFGNLPEGFIWLVVKRPDAPTNPPVIEEKKITDGELEEEKKEEEEIEEKVEKKKKEEEKPVKNKIGKKESLLIRGKNKK